MQIEFKEETMQINEPGLHQTFNLLVEGDVIVPDICPDVKDVLLIEGVPKLNSSGRTDAAVDVSGAVNIRVLYVPEDSNLPCKIDAKFDFADVFPVSASSDVAVSLHTEHIEFTLIHSRKLHIKVMVSVSLRTYEKRTLSFLTEASDDAPVRARKKPVSVYNVLADTVREVAVCETLEVPTAKPDVDEIVKLSVRVQRGECKIMAGKILLKGTLFVSTLYNGIDADSGVCHMEHELPFSEVADVTNLTDECMCHVTYQVQNVHYNLQEDANGDVRLLSLDVTLRAEIRASSTQEITVIDDCYSLCGRADIQKETLSVCDVLAEGVSHETIKSVMTMSEGSSPSGAVYSLECIPKIREITMTDDGMHIAGKLAAFALCGRADGENSLCSLVEEFDFAHDVPLDFACHRARTECNVDVENISFSLNAASEIELRCHLEFYSRVICEKDLTVVKACDLSDDGGETRCGMVIYFVQRGDSLWDIAKRYRTDESRIASVNHIEGSMLYPGQKLLIPNR